MTSKCTFSTGKSYSTGTGSFPRGLAVNDIDGNGNVDIIVTNTAADNITVLLNSGGGVFPVQLTSKTDHGYSPYSLAAVDMNGDGQVDVIVANSAGDNIGVVLNKGEWNVQGASDLLDGCWLHASFGGRSGCQR